MNYKYAWTVEHLLVLIVVMLYNRLIANESCVSDDDKKRRDSNSTDSSELEKIPYPKSVFFILTTEACERFSYYGMRGKILEVLKMLGNYKFFSAILSLYLRHLYTNSGWERTKAEDVSTVIYHTFVFFSYFTSLFGAFLADSFLGKFKTIFYISIVYAIGKHFKLRNVHVWKCVC